MEVNIRPRLSHSNSFGNDAEKDTAGCRAFNRKYIVIEGENLKPDRHYERKQHTFDNYCKRSIKNEAMNAYTQLRKRSHREISLSGLPEDAMAQLAVYDRYSWEYTTFPVEGAVILIEDDRLAEALLTLSQEDRDIFMMHWFLNMVDREIAEDMNMAHRTVNTRRQKPFGC